MPEPLIPSDWLVQCPLLTHARLYVVLGIASDAKPLAVWQTSAAGWLPQAILAGTAYAGWGEVMPYVGSVEPDSTFLDWIATTDAPNRCWSTWPRNHHRP